MPSKKSLPHKAIGDRLFRIRDRLAGMGNNRREFAKLMHWDEKRYEKWEYGVNCIPKEAVSVLIERFRITSDYIYFGRINGLDFEIVQRLGINTAA